MKMLQEIYGKDVDYKTYFRLIRKYFKLHACGVYGGHYISESPLCGTVWPKYKLAKPVKSTKKQNKTSENNFQFVWNENTMFPAIRDFYRDLFDNRINNEGRIYFDPKP